ncbi:hypothetical protein FOA52_000633 [Chlamydomonas sp. UWO 241]|nr:hypothetical protein FOA52_000633 [Chlamydomonas sp. UWO 241]
MAIRDAVDAQTGCMEGQAESPVLSSATVARLLDVTTLTLRSMRGLRGMLGAPPQPGAFPRLQSLRLHLGAASIESLADCKAITSASPWLTHLSLELPGGATGLPALMAGVFAGLRGLEAAVPTLWRMPLLNARKEPIWRLWPPARSVAVERAGELATMDLWDALASFAEGGGMPRGSSVIARAIPKPITIAGTASSRVRQRDDVQVDESMDASTSFEEESFANMGDYAMLSAGDIVRERTPWLAAFCIGLVLAAGVVDGFGDLIANHVALSFFVPLIMGHGGNTGSQATCAVIRALALKQISFRDITRIVAKEASAGAAMGAILGLGVSALAITTHVVEPDVGLVVAITMPLISLWSNALGAGLTLASAKLHLDPAMTSAPLVTTIVDTTGLVIYFSVAKAVMSEELLAHLIDGNVVASLVAP